MLSVIYRLLEVEGETDFAGPLMIDSVGIIRVADYLDPSQPASYSFVVEELSPDGTSSQSDIQTLTMSDILRNQARSAP